MQLHRVIPWGRSRREYEAMFGLSEGDRRQRILGCGDGPASFNAEITRHGWNVVSCDPVYAFSAPEIEQQFETHVESVISQVRANPSNYVWSFHRNPEDLLQHRRAVLRDFVSDYPMGVREGRYVNGALPNLPFAAGEFDLALCSHLLFLYSNVLSEEFHRASILELCRVAREVRIFPLTDLNCRRSRYVAPLQRELNRQGLRVQIETVDYQLQKNGNQMLRIGRPEGG